MVFYVKTRQDAFLIGQIISVILKAATKDGYLAPYVQQTQTGFIVRNFKISLECRVMD